MKEAICLHCSQAFYYYFYIHIFLFPAFFFLTTTLVTWYIQTYLKNVYTNIPLMHDLKNGYFVVTDCILIQFDCYCNL